MPGLFTLVATRRFPREAEVFRHKYAGFEAALRGFCRFRVTASPWEAFNGKDGRMGGPLSRLRRCHLVHGKALVLYAIVGQTVRLITVAEHDRIEGRAAHDLAAYARALGEGDFEPALILLEDADVAADARCGALSLQAVLPSVPRRPPASTLACRRIGRCAA